MEAGTHARPQSRLSSPQIQPSPLMAQPSLLRLLLLGPPVLDVLQGTEFTFCMWGASKA